MKQLQMLSIGLLALGLCSVNGESHDNLNFRAHHIVDDNSADDPVDGEMDSTSPSERAKKNKKENLPGNDDTSDGSSDDTSDLNNNSTDYDDD